MEAKNPPAGEHDESTHQIDAIDLKILAALQEKGRQTNIALATRVGITAPPCLRRVQKLEARGYIRGYHADVDPRKLGFQINAFVLVGLISQADDDVRAFENVVDTWPQVRECYSLSGKIDFLLRCVASDQESFQHFITETLARVPNVESVKIAPVASPPTIQRGLPIYDISSAVSRSARRK
ncbi:MAG: Lrp/AsnC family transcriptional regulator [Terriglobia bacterium]|nr:Lrp/AsnC family transcriptional regulator [Terriglobia bacterium]